MAEVTISELLRDAGALGIKLSSRSFWNYLEQGLLPKGRKLQGRGNCSYFSADSVLQLYGALLLKDLGAPHSILVEACSDPNLLIHLLTHLKGQSLPLINEGRRRVAEEYKNVLLDKHVLLETVKRAIPPAPPAPPVPPAPIAPTVKTLVKTEGRKFR